MVCVPLRYASVTLEPKFHVRGAMCGNDGRDAVTGATRGIWDPLPPTVTADERPRARVRVQGTCSEERDGVHICCAWTR